MIKSIYKSGASLALLATTAGYTSGAFAQATIVYGSASTAVPTLGGTALIALSALLLVVAVRLLKKQQHAGTNIVALVTAVSALAMAVGGIVVVSDTHARPAQVFLESDSGGEIQVPEGFSEVVNGTDQTHSLLAINADPGCMIGDPRNGGINGGVNGGVNGGGEGEYVGPCSDNPSTVLEPGDYCDISVFCDE